MVGGQAWGQGVVAVGLRWWEWGWGWWGEGKGVHTAEQEAEQEGSARTHADQWSYQEAHLF